MDGWDFKGYVLGMLFYHFISENLTAYLNDEAHRAGEHGFDYTALSDTDTEYLNVMAGENPTSSRPRYVTGSAT